MSLLDKLLGGIKTILSGGTPVPNEPNLNFGSGFTVTDNPGNSRTDVTISGGAPVTGVTGTAPITSTGGTTPAIGIAAATDSLPGSMSAADKTKLDEFVLTSPAQGDILYYNGTNFVLLAPGTAGQVLETQGAGANPQWATVSSSPDLGTLFAASRIQYWSGGMISAVSPGGFVNCTLSTSGSGAAVAPVSGGSVLQATARSQEQGGSGTGLLGLHDDTNLDRAAWRGNAAGLGGFRFSCRFGFDNTRDSATMQHFTGLHSGTPPVTSDFTTQTSLDCVGIGFSGSTTAGGAFTGNFQVISCDGTTVHLVDSGLPIVANSLYQVDISCISNDTIITWKITNLETGASTNGTINTNLPRNTKFLLFQSTLNVSVAGSGGSGTNDMSNARYMLEITQ